MSRDLYAAYERQERKRSHEQIQAETHGFTLNTKQKPIKTSDVVSLMPQATDEDVELSLRLKLAVDMKEKLSRLDVFEVVSLMTTQQHLVMQLAEALLHTSNIPLQQLFFMSLTSLLSTMNSRPSEQTANVRERLCDSLGHLDKILLRVLPVDEVIEVIDQEKARWTRKQVNALNKSTQVYRTHILRKCWISSYGKDKLIPIAVDKWLDFGETLLTFYHQLPQETILYNLPYKCQETLEFDEDRGLALISIKRVFGLDGINLVAFGVDSTEFAEFRDTLCAFKPGSVQILPTADPERIRSDHRQVAQTKTTGFHYRVNNERLQPRSPVHRTTPTIPTISLIARPSEPNLGSRNGFRTNLGKTRPQRGTFQQGHHRLHEETTQITALSAANLDSQGLVLPPTATNSQPVCHSAAVIEASREVVSTSFTPTHTSWNRAIRNRFRDLLPVSNSEMQRRPLLEPNPASDLTRAKAECLRDLKESMGYVEPEPIAMIHFPRWLMFVMASLVIIPWGFLMIQLYNS